tara:strand:- start:775 stop:945 length:171 start_codon:yes stop_codon:yes gene_type:complete
MMNVVMQLTKSTKNTHVYSNDAEDAAIPTLYIKKYAMEKNAPLKIVVTVVEELVDK